MSTDQSAYQSSTSEPSLSYIQSLLGHLDADTSASTASAQEVNHIASDFLTVANLVAGHLHTATEAKHGLTGNAADKGPCDILL